MHAAMAIQVGHHWPHTSDMDAPLYEFRLIASARAAIATAIAVVACCRPLTSCNHHGMLSCTTHVSLAWLLRYCNSHAPSMGWGGRAPECAKPSPLYLFTTARLPSSMAVFSGAGPAASNPGDCKPRALQSVTPMQAGMHPGMECEKAIFLQ